MKFKNAWPRIKWKNGREKESYLYRESKGIKPGFHQEE
jgi:hypothetical protein